MSTSIDINKWAIELDKVKARPQGVKGTYVAHYELNGRHMKKTLRTRRREVAMQRAVALESSLGNGSYQPDPPKLGIAEAVEDFLTAKTAEGISAKTLAKYQRELQEFAAFTCNSGKLHVRDIDERLFLSYRTARQNHNLLTKRDPIHEKTLYTATMIVRGFLRWCVRQRLVAENPVEHIRTAKPALQPHYAPPREVVNAILERATDPLRLMIMMLAFTGMRSGELQLLRVGEVDLAANWISVQTLKAKLTKLRPVRRVPLHARLRPALEAHLQTRRGGKGDLLLVGPTGGPIDQGDLNTDLQAIAAELKFPVGRKNDGIVVHSLRHFFETETVNAGIPQRVIDVWLGHTGDRSMGNVYYRLSDTDSQNMMNRVHF